MSRLIGTAVTGDRWLSRFFLFTILGICIAGVFVFWKGLTYYTVFVDFAPVHHIPLRSGTQATPKPVFNTALSPLTSGYITGTATYPPGSDASATGLYICGTSLDGAGLYCTNPVDLRSTGIGKLAFSLMIPKGTYYVYAAVPGRQYEAFYERKTDLSLIPVVVNPGKVVTGVTPNDWSQP